MIPVIDLFAGAGGLGEGFARYTRGPDRCFEVSLSVDASEDACRTLLLRHFFNAFPDGKAPDAYYAYVRGESGGDLKELLDSHHEEGELARASVRHAVLGSPVCPDEQLDTWIRDALGGQSFWVLVGGPPCQAYSLIGRSRMRDRDTEVFELDVRHRLYEHYLRVLAVHRPPVFLMENVKGLLSTSLSSEKLVTKMIGDLEDPIGAVGNQQYSGGRGKEHPRYKLYPLSAGAEQQLGLPGISPGVSPSDMIVMAEDHGLPQCRHRVFILGIRNDLDKGPPHTLPRTGPCTVRQVISDLPPLRSKLSREEDQPLLWAERIQHELGLTDLSDVPDTLKAALETAASELGTRGLETGGRFVPGRAAPSALADWFVDERLGGFLNHESRPHRVDDLVRYLYLSVFSQKEGRSPKLREFPEALLPQHESAKEAVLHRFGYFNDRFRVQVWDEPSSTVTSHAAKDGHYYIHPDPLQCRSLTVREAARLQTFPDNYFFEGSRTSQYTQIGNAVPPFLARQIAALVEEILVTCD